MLLVFLRSVWRYKNFTNESIQKSLYISVLSGVPRDFLFIRTVSWLSLYSMQMSNYTILYALFFCPLTIRRTSGLEMHGRFFFSVWQTANPWALWQRPQKYIFFNQVYLQCKYHLTNHSVSVEKNANLPNLKLAGLTDTFMDHPFQSLKWGALAYHHLCGIHHHILSVNIDPMSMKHTNTQNWENMGVSHITHALGESLGTSTAHSMNLVPTQISYLCN